MGIIGSTRGRRSGDGDLVAVLEARVHELSDRLELQKAAQARQRQRLADQTARNAQHDEKLAELEFRFNALNTVYQVLEHQMATFETRLNRLDVVLHQPAPTSTDAERSEARALIDEVREEHARIRARFGVVARYEERVRRLERALEPEPNR